MDYYVARAMQIATMDPGQITDLEAAERTRGHAFQNWEIQRMFSLGTIRDRCMIPEEPGEQEKHQKRVKNDLHLQKIALWMKLKKSNDKGDERTEDVPPWETLTIGNLEWLHAFDHRVYDAQRENRISFFFQGAGPSKGSRLRDRIEGGRQAAMEAL